MKKSELNEIINIDEYNWFSYAIVKGKGLDLYFDNEVTIDVEKSQLRIASGDIRFNVSTRKIKSIEIDDSTIIINI